MDVLVCPSCSTRYAVGGSGENGGWRCTNCSAELQIEQNDLPRLDLLERGGQPSIVDGHLHRLDSSGDAALDR
jgi:tRNA(Ile2) C34 agmatinyltransferase TiaS